jgi:predicted dehydrogenase
MKFMIAGLGSIGRRHFQNLRSLGENDILLYRSHLGALPEDELAGYPAEQDLATALAHQPDAVIVSNPTALHLDVAIPAARSGCHLFIEKPVSHSMDHIDQLKDAVQRGGGQVLVGYQFRFHPGLRRVKHLLAEGAIGDPLSVRAHWGEYLPSWHPWEDYRHGYSARQDLGGGVILTLSHPLDYLRWLFGEVVEVWALAGKLSDLELQVEDNAEIGLRFASGVLGSLHLDYNQRPPTHHLEIIGAHGTLRWDNADGKTALFRAEHGQWEYFPLTENFERNHLFLAQMEHFLEVIKLRTTPMCSLEDGIQALRLSLAAHKSQNQGALIHL